MLAWPPRRARFLRKEGSRARLFPAIQHQPVVKVADTAPAAREWRARNPPDPASRACNLMAKRLALARDIPRLGLDDNKTLSCVGNDARRPGRSVVKSTDTSLGATRTQVRILPGRPADGP